MKQLNLIPKPNLSGGGSLINTRHSKRVLSSKLPMHLVLTVKKGRDLFKRRLWVKSLLQSHAAKFGIKVYASSIQRDHLHLIVKIPNRRNYVGFIRAVTGVMARKIGKGIWHLRPFTRVTSWGRDFRQLLDYLFKNDMEVFGVWDYSPRTRAAPALRI